MNQKLLRNLLKIVFTIAVFFLTVILTSRRMNRAEAQVSARMAEPSFPVVSFSQNGVICNRLYGYANDMDISSLRGTLYLTDETRACEAYIETFGARVEDIFYELRTIDGDNLIEKTRIDNAAQSEDGVMRVSFTMKDLIDTDTEYMLAIIIETHEGKVIRYYTRVLCSEDETLLGIADHLDFVSRFSEMTFQKDPGIKEYLESKAPVSGQSYEYVDIRSPLEYVTWEGLEITDRTEPIIDVFDVHGQTATISLSYQLSFRDEDFVSVCDVKENYFTRLSQGKMYLIDFRRTMEGVIDPDRFDFRGNYLNFSYANNPITFSESEAGGTVCFENAGRLFVWQLTDNRVTTALSFRDLSDANRLKKQGCKIGILRTEESGNVFFSVTGYFSRGEHEGKVGTAVYEFDAAYNYITEYIFIESSLSEEVLMQTSGNFGYLGNDGKFYSLQGDSLYAIGLYSGEIKQLAELASEKNLSASVSGNLIAWQNDAKDLTSGISVLKPASGEISVIKGESGDGVRMLSFVGNDLVYGFVREADIQKNLMGDTLYPCYRVIIADEDGNVISKYDSENAPVISAVQEQNRVVLKRISRETTSETSESLAYKEAPDDQITSSEEISPGVNLAVTRPANIGSYKGIEFAKAPNPDKSKKLEAEITGKLPVTPLVTAGLPEGRFICYDHGKATGVYPTPGPAVSAAYTLCGQVVNEKGDYMYYRGNLTKKNQIMSLTKAVAEKDYSTMDSLAACLSVMMEYEGAAGNPGSLLASGNTMGEIIKKTLPVATVLDLNGCPLQAMTYYLDLMCDYPVLAAASDTKFVLLIGFNDTEVVLFDPTQPYENVYKMSIKEAAETFRNSGNRFLTYVK